jgi:hypothetical protein
VPTGAIDSARARQQLKLVLMAMLALELPHADAVVGQAKEKSDVSFLKDLHSRMGNANAIVPRRM